MLTTTDLNNIHTSLISAVSLKVTYLELFKEDLSLKNLSELEQKIIEEFENDIDAFYETIFAVGRLINIVESDKDYTLHLTAQDLKIENV